MLSVVMNCEVMGIVELDLRNSWYCNDIVIVCGACGKNPKEVHLMTLSGWLYNYMHIHHYGIICIWAWLNGTTEWYFYNSTWDTKMTQGW